MTLAEFLNAAGGIHDLVLAGIKRMRFGRDFDTDDRVFLAVGPHHFFAALGLDGRAGHEFEIGGRIKKDNFVIVGVNAGFHAFYLSFRKGCAEGEKRGHLYANKCFEESIIMPQFERKGKINGRCFENASEKRLGGKL